MAASTVEILRLRGELEARFGRAILPGTAPEVERFDGFRTGVAAIDGLLPQGVARGALSLWTGERTAGLTAALRALVIHSCSEGARVAVIDTGLTLDASFGCTAAGPVEGLWVVRPPDTGYETEGAWAAESLLRAGVFDLVVLDGCALEGAQAHRLRALARERNAAVVVSTAGKRKEEGGKRNHEYDIRVGARASAFEAPHDFAAPRDGAEQKLATWLEPAYDTPGSGNSGDMTSFLFPRSSLLEFRADLRLEFRCGGRTAGEGLMPGGRFRARARVTLAKPGVGARGSGDREVEVVHESADRLRTHRPAPDRSRAGR